MTYAMRNGWGIDFYEKLSFASQCVRPVACLTLLGALVQLMPRSKVNLLGLEDDDDALCALPVDGPPRISVAKALFSFEGRMCREDYWIKGRLVLLPLTVLYYVLIYNYPHVLRPGAAGDDQWVYMTLLCLEVVMTYPNLALTIKRLHDRDMSGWNALILFIPIFGPLLILVSVGFVKGTNGPNRYGPDPLAQSSELATA